VAQSLSKILLHLVFSTKNHVHIACTLPRTMTISKLLEEIKKSSSKWIKSQHTDCQNFSWQAGYGAFSLGQSQLETLINYIDRSIWNNPRALP
jgi:putative transposase